MVKMSLSVPCLWAPLTCSLTFSMWCPWVREPQAFRLRSLTWQLEFAPQYLFLELGPALGLEGRRATQHFVQQYTHAPPAGHQKAQPIDKSPLEEKTAAHKTDCAHLCSSRDEDWLQSIDGRTSLLPSHARCLRQSQVPYTCRKSSPSYYKTGTSSILAALRLQCSSCSCHTRWQASTDFGIKPFFSRMQRRSR